MTHNEARRPGAGTAGQETAGEHVTASVAEFADAYAAAELWVRWTARRRWPDFPCNDSVWAVSVASWECAGRRRERAA